MTGELRDKVAALRALAPDLNAATDEVNRVVEAVERLLRDELKLGISAQSNAFSRVLEDAEDEDEEAPYTLSYLAFGRLLGTFQIYVLEVTEKQGIDNRGCCETKHISSTPCAWSNCPREVRLQAVTKLPELLGAIAGAAHQKIRQAREATSAVRDLIDALGGTPASEVKAPAKARKSK